MTETTDRTDDATPRMGRRSANDRRCIATGAALPPDQPALRFALGPSGEIVPDLRGDLPGRGAWLTPTRAALLMAVRKGSFPRAFKAPARLPEGVDAETFADRLETALKASALQKLGLARRAGSLVIGHDRVRQAKGRPLAYLTPADASPAETEKVANLLHKRDDVPHLRLPTGRAELGAAIGQDAVHLLLVEGGPSSTAFGAVILWSGFSA